MSVGDHSLDHGWVGRCSIDGPFAHIVSRDEESCREVELLQNIEEGISIEVWAIVKGQGHHIMLGAVDNILGISDRSKCWSRVIYGWCACRCVVGVTSTISILAIGISAIIR